MGNTKENELKEAIVIFSPHPDDETLGCAGTVMKARNSGKQVRIVFLTNGSGYPMAATILSRKRIRDLTTDDFLAVGKERQKEALSAAQMLGLTPENLVFLGYPSSALDKLPDTPSRQALINRYTGKNCTYGLVVPDYHTQTYGIPAPYERAAIVEDMTDIIRSSQAREIYVTDGFDRHKDHKAAFQMAHDAANAAGFNGKFFTYLIHASTGMWPWPRSATPDQPFESRSKGDPPEPSCPSWPPDDRRPMTQGECSSKLATIRTYTLEMRLEGWHFESFIKSEEVFWLRNIAQGLPPPHQT